jgi:hypothetical protein
MKWAAILACIAFAMPMVATAQTGADQANRRAYTYALRCFASAAGIISDRQATPTAIADARIRSRRSFDTAHRMGGVLGLSTDRVNGDIESASRVEAALLVRNATYAQRTHAECISLGL